MIKKFLTVAGLAVAATTALSATSTAAYADGACGTVDGNGVCIDSLPSVGGGTTVTVTSPTQVCFFVDCIENGETVATVPVPVSNVTPGIHTHVPAAEPVNDVGCFINETFDELQGRDPYCERELLP